MTPPLEHQWQRCRRQLSIAFLWLPAMHGGVCLTLLSIAMTGTTPAAWWILPLLGSALPFAVQLAWLARSGVTDPPSWGKSAVLPPKPGNALEVGHMRGGAEGREHSGVCSSAPAGSLAPWTVSGPANMVEVPNSAACCPQRPRGAPGG